MPWSRSEIAARMANDISPGWVVNLGIGAPMLVSDFVDHERVLIHSENGIVGLGGEAQGELINPDIVDSGRRPMTVVPGASFMDSATSFAIMRGGHLDLAIMGAYQVSCNGDIANWNLPRGDDAGVGGIGGAADLAIGAKRIWVFMSHLTREGKPKLVRNCTLPLTARGVVTRIYTERCLCVVRNGVFEVVEFATGESIETVREATSAPVIIAQDRTSVDE